MFPYIQNGSQLFDETETWFAADEHPVSLPEVEPLPELDTSAGSTPPVPADD